MKLGQYKIKVIASNIRNRMLQDKMLFHADDFEVMDGNAGEGDVVLLKVLDNSAAYDRLENIHGRSVRIYQGDYIVGILGNRFSGQNLFGHWEPAFLQGKVLHLLTNGGIVGICDDAPQYKGSPLRLEPVGLIHQEGKPINIARDFGDWDHQLNTQVPLVIICGTSGETGKTTVAKDIIRYLKRNSEFKIAGVKLAGTGCMEDILEMLDAGGDLVGDLSDVGLASTYCDFGKVGPAIYTLLNKLSKQGADLFIAELGGDVTGGNVANILQDQSLMKNVISIVLTYFDILGLLGIKGLFTEYAIHNETIIAHNIQRNITASNQRLKSWGINYAAYNMNDESDKEKMAARIIAKLKCY